MMRFEEVMDRLIANLETNSGGYGPRKTSFQVLRSLV